MDAMTLAIESAMPEPRSDRAAITVIAISAAINLIAAALLAGMNFWGLWDITPGTHFRSPLPAYGLMGGVAALLQTFILAIVALILGRRSKRIWIFVIFLVLLGFVPLFVAGATFDWITSIHHLELD